MKTKIRILFMLFFTIFIFLVCNSQVLAETDSSPTESIDYGQVEKIISELVSDNMKDMVKTAPTDNYLIYAFILIAIFILITMIIVLKISSNTSSKNMKYTLEPTLIQISETMARVQLSSEKMADKFSNLSERIIETQAYRIGEEDKLDLILNRIQEIKKEISNSNAALHSAFRDHQTIESDGSNKIQLSLEKMDLSLANLQSFCKTKNNVI